MNPYESPTPAADESPKPRNRLRSRSKPWWAFLLASAVGAFVVGPLFLPLTAQWDDSGGIQVMLGAIVVPFVYQLFV